MTGIEMRQQLAKRIRGRGVEFGAGAYPFPVPPFCQVLYADRNSPSQLAEREYFGLSGTVATNLQTDISEMEGIEDNSLDFIIASHVIEHTANPIGAITKAHKKLKTEGILVLIVPDKHVTFDKLRGVTTVDHLVADYLMPSRERDFEHYIEFFRLSFPQPDFIESARGVWARGDDIHFHTWTYESFGEMVNYIENTYECTWRDIWAHPRLSENDLEFFYVLLK